jgi:hypothetical protein
LLSGIDSLLLVAEVSLRIVNKRNEFLRLFVDRKTRLALAIPKASISSSVIVYDVDGVCRNVSTTALADVYDEARGGTFTLLYLASIATRYAGIGLTKT